MSRERPNITRSCTRYWSKAGDPAALLEGHANMDILREAILITLFLVIWLGCAYIHNKTNTLEPQMMPFPKLICRLFGSFRPENILSAQALFGQVFFLGVTIIVSLFTLQLISPLKMYIWLKWLIFVGAILALVMSVLIDMRGKNKDR